MKPYLCRHSGRKKGEREKQVIDCSKEPLLGARDALKAPVRLKGFWLRRIVYKQGTCLLIFE